MRVVLLLLFVAGCSNLPSSPSDAGPFDAGSKSSGSPDAGSADAGSSDASFSDASSPDAGSSDGGPFDAGPSQTTIRVHYPAGSHAITIRGGTAPLSWTQGVAMTDAGQDVWTYTSAKPGGALEWKPLLDDATWSLGPNYHVNVGDTVDVYPHFTTMKGQVITLIAAFHSTVLNNDRPIFAYLPASYAENTDATYPVVYMQDGQNLWAALPQDAYEGMTWNVDTTFDEATAQGACSSGGVVGWGAQPLGGTPTTCNGDGDCPSMECRTFPEAIVIGVANTTNRIYEYTPTTDPTTSGGGGGDLYIQMLIQELKPQIDNMLRTRGDVLSTLLAGSSLGGLIAAYAGYTHPEVFGRIGALSPSAWWNNEVIVSDVALTAPAPERPLTVYVDSGAGAVDDESYTDALASTYVGLGYVSEQNFRYVVQPNAAHNETYWAERFPGAMQLLLGER